MIPNNSRPVMPGMLMSLSTSTRSNGSERTEIVQSLFPAEGEWIRPAGRGLLPETLGEGVSTSGSSSTTSILTCEFMDWRVYLGDR